MSLSNPKYSLIVPVYNVEKYLPYCLDSIKAQICTNFELILINDGSTDNSLKICEAFKEENPFIETTVINQENKGLFFARRSGYVVAKGEYIWSIDSDDTILPNALEMIDIVLNRTDADMAFFERSTSKNCSIYKINSLFKEQCYVDRNNKNKLVKAYCSGTIYPIVTKVIRREFICKDTDYSSFKNLNYSEDELAVIDIINSIGSAVYIPEALYFWRSNNGSITGRYSRGLFRQYDLVFKTQIDAIAKWSNIYSDESLQLLFFKSVLGNMYFNIRKSISVIACRDLVDEVKGLDLFYVLRPHFKTLRFDLKLFWNFVNTRNYFGVYVLCKSMKLLAKVKDRLIRNQEK